jgi:hypothetical protein
VCAPGYQFLDEDFTVLSEADGEVDCQPIQFEWCPVGTRRLASGTCSAIDCNQDCSSGRGTFSSQMGICMCEGLTPTSVICDSTCRASATQVLVDPVTKLLNVTDPTTNQTTILDPATDIPGFFGEFNCIPRSQQVSYVGYNNATATNDPGFATMGGDSCAVYTIDVSASGGFRGVFNAPSVIFEALPANTGSRRRRMQADNLEGAWSASSKRPVIFSLAGSDVPLVAGASPDLTVHPLVVEPASAHSRQLAYAEYIRSGGSPEAARSHAATTGVGRKLQTTLSGPSISNPVTCLELGQSLAFQVDYATQTYPVYVKDSFLNSNPSFDYGQFRALAALMVTNGSNIELFSFTFTQNGTYIFSSSTDSKQQIIVRVMGAGQRCPVEAQFVPMTSDNLVQLAVQEAGQPVLQPNWILIGSLIGGLLGVVLVVIGGLYYFRYRAWGDVSGYRRRRNGAVMGESKYSKKKQAADGPRFKRKSDENAATSHMPLGVKSKDDTRAGSHANDAALENAEAGRGDDHMFQLQEANRLDPDDLDLAELVEKLKEHHGDVTAAFKDQQEAAAQILSTLREEADNLRRMIAAAALDSASATMTSGAVAQNTAQNARRAAVLRQIEAELAARALHDRSITRREGEILTALHELSNLMGHDAPGVSDEIVFQLMDAAGTDDNADDADFAAFIAANRRVKAENSETAEDIRIRTTNIKEMIARSIASVVEERERRNQGLPLWKAAAGSGLLETLPEVVRVLEQFETGVEPVDAAQAGLLELLRVFALGSDVFLNKFKATLGNFIKELTKAREQQNPAVVERVRGSANVQVATQVDDLIKAVDVVLGKVPSLQSKLEIARARSNKHLSDCMPAVKKAREQAEQTAEASRVSSSGADALMNALNKLIEQAQSGAFTRTIVRGRGDDWDEDENEQGQYVDPSAFEDDSVPDGNRQMAAALVAQVEQEAQREQAAIVAKIQETALAAHKDSADATEQSRQDAIRAILSDPNLNEAERQRLLAEFESDQVALMQSLDMERQRQGAELAKKLEEKKRDKLAKKVRLAEAKAIADAEAKAKAEIDRLLEQQDRQRKEELARLQQAANEELNSAEALQAAALDTTFSVESQLNQLREQFSQELASVDAAVDAERRRQAASLQARLKDRRDKKLRALHAKQAAELALAETDADRAHVLDAHAQEVQMLAAQLAEEDQNEVSRGGEALNQSINQASQRRLELQAEFDRRLGKLATGIDMEQAKRSEAIRQQQQDARNSKIRELSQRQAKELAAATTEEERAVLRARHATELATLQSVAEADADREQTAVDAAASAARAALAAAQIEAQLQALRTQHDAEVSRVTAAKEVERARQASELQRKLQMRREEQLLRLQRKHAEELANTHDEVARERLTSKHAAELDSKQRDLDARDEADATELEKLQSKADDDMHRRIADLHAALERDVLGASRALNAERARQQASTASKLAERKLARERAMKQRHDAAMATAADDMTRRALQQVHNQDLRAASEIDAQHQAAAAREAAAFEAVINGKINLETELARLRAEHEAEVTQLDTSLHSERVRQEAALQRKLADRRTKRQLQVLREQQLELQDAVHQGAAPADQALLKRQHVAQLVALEEEIAVEDATDFAVLQQDLRSMASSVESEKRNNAANLEEAAAKIREQFEGEQQKALASIQGEKRRQKATLEAKLAQRNARKLRQLNFEQQKALAEAEEVASKAVEVSMGGVVNVAEEASAASRVEDAIKRELDMANVQDRDVLKRQSEMDAENDRRKQQLQARQEQERKRLEAEMAAEAEREAAAKIKESEAARRAQLDSKRKEMELRLNAMNLSNTEEVDRVRREHEHELAQYEASTDEERRRQKEKLDRQLEARRAKKAKELKRKQDEEMAVELSRQAEAAASLEAEAAARKEKEAVQKALLTQPEVITADKAGEAIEMIMQQRHTTETADLIARQYAERAKVLKAGLELLFERKREEQADMMEALREAGATQSDVESALQALQRKYDEEKSRTERAVIEDIEVKHAQEQLALRQRQLGELSNAFQELAPEDVLRRHEAEEASREAAKLREFQTKMLKDKEERLAKIKREKESFESNLRRQNEEDLAKLDADHAAQLSEERKRAEDQLNLRKERLMREQEELKRKKLEESSGLDMEARDRIMKEFEDNQARMEAKLDVVRSQQQSKLEARLTQRKEKQKRMKERELAEKLREQESKSAADAATVAGDAAKNAAEADAKAKADAAAKAAAALSTVNPAAVAMRSAVDKTAAKAAQVLKRADSARQLEAGQHGAGGLEADFDESSLKGSKGTAMLEKRLAQVEGLLQKVAEHAKLQSRALVTGTTTGNYADPTDAASPTEGALKVAEGTTARENMRLQFGAKLLAVLGMPEIKLLAASTLPHNSYANNAFRNSMYFDVAAKTLFIRAGRLQNAGDVMLVIVHAAAHIRVNPNDLANDFDPRFIGEFHRCLKVCALELFKFQQAESTKLK